MLEIKLGIVQRDEIHVGQILQELWLLTIRNFMNVDVDCYMNLNVVLKAILQ